MAQQDVSVLHGYSGFPLPVGQYNVSTVVKNAQTGIQVAEASQVQNLRVKAGSTRATEWRRRFRRYCHWLIRQADNATNGVGVIFSSGFSPSVTEAEFATLSAVKTALYGMGYRTGAPLGPAPISPP